jgi:hypothetical protein
MGRWKRECSQEALTLLLAMARWCCVLRLIHIYIYIYKGWGVRGEAYANPSPHNNPCRYLPLA